jgi:hypothetical protein
LIIPIGIADLYIMLWVHSVVGKFMEGPENAEKMSGPDYKACMAGLKYD